MCAIVGWGGVWGMRLEPLAVSDRPVFRSERLCIATELLTKPRLLFLDEPTSG